MNKFKGTKGEWKLVRQYSDEHGNILFMTIVDEDNQNVAEAKGHEKTNVECMANAKLIAAAPNLLEALQEMQTDLKILYGNMRVEASVNKRFEGLPELIKKWIERNEKAINKALGL